MTQIHTTQPYLAPQQPQQSQYPQPHQSPAVRPAAVFGTVFFEVVLSGAATTPSLPGWNLRLWPQARLGDATLEASPAVPQADQHLSDLLTDLSLQGVNILGPVRLHR